VGPEGPVGRDVGEAGRADVVSIVIADDAAGCLRQDADQLVDVFRLDEPDFIAVYGRRLMLVRPDQHIAWRGTACDDRLEAELIIARVLGFLN
jgi:hypothetical protein